MNESDLLQVRAFGKTSLKEVKRKLGDLGLTLGMEIPQDRVGPLNFPPPPVIPQMGAAAYISDLDDAFGDDDDDDDDLGTDV